MLLHERLKDYNIILGSASPRRRQLLADCDFQFTVAEKFECDETFPATMPVSQVASFLSQTKSKAYPLKLSEKDILITADTVVIVDNQILGKPKDASDAFAMLSLLNNRAHVVTTGVTIRSASNTHTFSVDSTVRFRKLTDEEITYYIEKYHPFDKAGSYGIQEWIGYAAIEGIEGSFFNVMGLPVQRLYTELQSFISH
ncbi:MAG: septum formation protein Maf [Alistipes sp.]|nr:septum formation protein Maf [Alistipes sp.]